MSVGNPVSLPQASARLVDGKGFPTREFYRFFQSLASTGQTDASEAQIAAINAEIAAIQKEIDNLPASKFPTLRVTEPITSAGLLQNGFARIGLTVANSVVVNGVSLQLDGDADAPGNTYLYSTGLTGTKGWNALGGMLAGTADNITKTVNADGSVTFDLAVVSDSGTGTFKLITRDSFGRLSGTEDGTTSDVPEGENLYFTDARVDARLSPGYIDGLQMQWVSGTAVTVSSGTAYIPSLGAYLQSNAAIALSGLSLSASTWYHLYLYSNAGTPAVECVTTAPVLYYGTAYQKTGDNSRRYIGSVYAHAANTISRFIHVAGSCRVQYEQDLNTPGQEILALGQSATEVIVSVASACPVTSRIAQCYAENTDTSNIAFLSNPDLGTPTSNILAYLRPASSLKSTVLVVDLLMNDLQQITYMMQAASATGLGLTIWVRGFFYGR